MKYTYTRIFFYISKINDILMILSKFPKYIKLESVVYYFNYEIYISNNKIEINYFYLNIYNHIGHASSYSDLFPTIIRHEEGKIILLEYCFNCKLLATNHNHQFLDEVYKLPMLIKYNNSIFYRHFGYTTNLQQYYIKYTKILNNGRLFMKLIDYSFSNRILNDVSIGNNIIELNKAIRQNKEIEILFDN